MRGRPPLPAGPFLVVGLARSGAAAALALQARGLRVRGVDAGQPAGVDELRERGIEVQVGGEEDRMLDGVGTVVKSPGVPADAPLIAQARARSIPVVGELELAWRMLPSRFVAVTGTNGKTTTTELIGHLHRSAGLPVAVAGNIGNALSTLALPQSAPTAPTIVCEVSSFQLEDAQDFAPEAAVLLNLTPDHLDRHGSMEAYRAAKLKVFAAQGPEDIAVLPAELDLSPREVGSPAREVRFGSGPSGRGAVYEREGSLWWEEADGPLLALDELGLRGAHNVQNAMAAAAVCLVLGLDLEAVRAGLSDFAGVPHRLEELGRLDGVLFVNDSKATNVASTLVALAAFRPLAGRLAADRSAALGVPSGTGAPDGSVRRGASVHLILGGQGKGQDFRPLQAELERSARHVYLIGEDAPVIAEALAGIGPPLHMCQTLERAVELARAEASPGEVLLLSPGCASFDQFTDFEARGERFREIFSAA